LPLRSYQWRAETKFSTSHEISGDLPMSISTVLKVGPTLPARSYSSSPFSFSHPHHFLQCCERFKYLNTCLKYTDETRAKEKAQELLDVDIMEERRLPVRNVQSLDWEWSRSWLCEDLHINLGTPAKECRDKRLH